MDALQQLKQEMSKKENRGCYVRTANQLDCTSNWVWKVINNKTYASEDVVQRIVTAALNTLEQINKERKARQNKTNAISNAIANRLEAIQA